VHSIGGASGATALTAETRKKGRFGRTARVPLDYALNLKGLGRVGTQRRGPRAPESDWDGI